MASKQLKGWKPSKTLEKRFKEALVKKSKASTHAKQMMEEDRKSLKEGADSEKYTAIALSGI